MPRESERLSALDATVFREQLRQALQAAFGAWERAEGTGLDAEQWFAVLADAVQAEAGDWPVAIELCGFALAEIDGPAQTPWAVESLRRSSAAMVLTEALAGLEPGDLATPESAKAFFARLRRRLRASQGLRGQDVMDAIRASLTGSQRGPCLGIVAALLGPSRARHRLEEQLTCLRSA